MPISKLTRTSRSVLLATLMLAGFTTRAPALDFEEFGVFRLVDRVAGTPVAVEPYAVEACVVGTGILSATITLPGGGMPIDLEVEDDEWCAEDSFDTHEQLIAAYPDGDYTFNVVGDTGNDSKTLTMSASEPEAYVDVSNPTDGAILPPNTDLTVTWSLVEKGGSSCLSTGPAACADQIFIEVDNLMTDQEIADQLLPITDTSFVIDGADLPPNSLFSIEIETFRGAVNLNDTSDMGRPVLTAAIYEDLNNLTFETPEPSGSLLAGSSLAALGWLRRRPRA